MAAKNQPNELYLTRLLDASVKDVWNAWVEPDQVAQWWGPRGFTITTVNKDVRTGGTWKYTMHGPDGTDYPNFTTYLEVDPYSRLVYDHGGTETTPPMFRVTVLFTEMNGKTKMEMTMAFSSAAAAEEAKKFIKKAGGESTWDRLAEYLVAKSGKEVFIINRTFDAPLATMFEMWTNPNHLVKWTPPVGFEMSLLRSEIKPGGSNFYSMFSHNIKMFGKSHYLEIRRPDRIVYTQQFCDENENISRHPAAPTWPKTMLTTISLAEEGSQKTRVTVTWEPFGAVTSEELKAFIMARSGMTGGWTGSFDKLEGYLLIVS